MDERSTAPDLVETRDGVAEWCVEVGDLLAAMESSELWDAIDRGEVTADTRVWREGLDGWTPVEELPELAPAVESARFRPGDDGAGAAGDELD